MSSINIICIGKKTSTQISELISDYEKRLHKFVKINWVIIPAIDGKMSIDEQKSQESKKIISKLNHRYTILLDETGRELDNIGLANFLVDSIDSNELNIVIGGAYGVSDELKQKADAVLSLSKLVLPHQIVRLVIVEQIYRSYSIINNLPYHHQ